MMWLIFHLKTEYLGGAGGKGFLWLYGVVGMKTWSLSCIHKITLQIELFARRKGGVKKCRQAPRWEGEVDQQFRQVCLILSIPSSAALALAAAVALRLKQQLPSTTLRCWIVFFL